ncbi:DUF4177 domain-containing protein [Clostridium vincentii]|uniref:DUF4177 domain-containing protein n=1 Tax=Clostridium vincentii TaxID=52704 RepID=A0A2T0BDW0_9CLOT|nr:DUF4177 domain-containing protein [Clostridium vincentii]PRR82043.1 hypothetical protein CLVI_21080 [Clostridium vincentii]
MYEYKVFKWRFDLSSAKELEVELNKYAKDGWRIFNITTNLKGSLISCCLENGVRV